MQASVQATVGHPIGFVKRDLCPLCASAGKQSLWQGRFSDPEVVRHLSGFHYSGDTAPALGDEAFALVRCTACGMAYHARHADEAGLIRIYRDWTDSDQVRLFEADHRSPVAGEEGRRRIKTVLRLHHLVRQRFAADAALRLLDFGCGNGETMQAASLIGFETWGVDLSTSRAATAGSAERPVYPDLAAFDRAGHGPLHAVVLDQVLEHLTDPLGLLQALAGRMLAGGVLFLAAPDCSGIAVPTGFDQFHAVQPLEHLNAFTPETLKRMAARAGFTRCRRPPTFLGTSLKQALRNAAGMLWQPQTTDAYFRLT